MNGMSESAEFSFRSTRSSHAIELGTKYNYWRRHHDAYDLVGYAGGGRNGAGRDIRRVGPVRKWGGHRRHRDRNRSRHSGPVGPRVPVAASEAAPPLMAASEAAPALG